MSEPAQEEGYREPDPGEVPDDERIPEPMPSSRTAPPKNPSSSNSPRKPATQKGKLQKVTIVLLDETEFYCDIEKRAKGEQLVDLVCDHLDIVEKDYFGLTYRDSQDCRVSTFYAEFGLCRFSMGGIVTRANVMEPLYGDATFAPATIAPATIAPT